MAGIPVHDVTLAELNPPVDTTKELVVDALESASYPQKLEPIDPTEYSPETEAVNFVGLYKERVEPAAPEGVEPMPGGPRSDYACGGSPVDARGPSIELRAASLVYACAGPLTQPLAQVYGAANPVVTILPRVRETRRVLMARSLQRRAALAVPRSPTPQPQPSLPLGLRIRPEPSAPAVEAEPEIEIVEEGFEVAAPESAFLEEDEEP